MIHYSNSKPNKRVYTRLYGMESITLNYALKMVSKNCAKQLAEQYGVEFTEEFEQEHKYSFYSVTLPLGETGRSAEISAIVSDRYPVDKMQAIQNNFIEDPEDERNAAEMKEMQDWRKYAKRFADDLED